MRFEFWILQGAIFDQAYKTMNCSKLQFYLFRIVNFEKDYLDLGHCKKMCYLHTTQIKVALKGPPRRKKRLELMLRRPIMLEKGHIFKVTI